MRIQSSIARATSLLLLMTLPGVLQAQLDYTTVNNTITITGYTGPGGALDIPSTIIGLPVTGIGDSAFYDQSSLTSVTIPTSITNIGDYAFYGCTNLASIMIPSGVPRIGNYQFRGCSSLASVTLPNSVTGIGYGAFAYCNSLTSITIPNGVTSIGFQAMAYCTNLTEVYFRGDAPSLGSFALDGDNFATVYYLPGTAGWLAMYGGRPTKLWEPLVTINDASFGIRTNQFGFNVAWASGHVIVVDACTNLAYPFWSALKTNTLVGDSYYFSDPQWVNDPCRFYRIRSP